MSDSDCDTSSNIPKKRARRVQYFRKEWLKDTDFKYWLIPVEGNPDLAGCRLCNTQFKSELSVIKNHKKSTKHIKSESSIPSTSSITKFFSSSQLDDTKNIKRCEIIMAAFLAENNLPFSLADTMLDTFRNAAPDSKILAKASLQRTKSTAIITNVLGKYEKQNLINLLLKTKFSILTDESTDISISKLNAIVVRFYCHETNKLVSKFYELTNVFVDGNTKCDAETLYKLITDAFFNKNIPKNNIIGFASDGCNVMMGEKNSLSSRFKDNFEGIKIMKCICHSLHLCASEACKELPRTPEDLARNVHNFFKTSSKRLAEYQEFQSFAQVNIHKLLHPSQTRWLSLHSVVMRILEQWNALVIFFNQKYLGEKLLAAEQIHKSLNDPFIAMYFKFLDWILPKFTQLNLYFQKNSAIILNLHSTIISGYTDILLCYMKNDYVLKSDINSVDPTNTTQFKSKSQLYLGVNILNDLNKPEIQANKPALDYFYDRCFKFFSKACSQIKQRYDFVDPLLSRLHIFLPRNAVLIDNRLESLVPLLNNCKRFANFEDWQKIDDEWRRLSTFPKNDLPDLDLEADEFWGKMLNLTVADEYLFKNLSSFVLNILSLPHSNAECESVQQIKFNKNQH